MTWVKARDDSGNFIWPNMALVRSLVRVVDALPNDPEAKTVVCFDEADTHTVHETPEYLIGESLKGDL
jgi:hypothetical protein